MMSRDLKAFSIAGLFYAGIILSIFFNPVSLIGEEQIQKSAAPLAVHYKIIKVEKKSVAKKEKKVKKIAKKVKKSQKTERKVVKVDDSLKKTPKKVIPEEPVAKEMAKAEPAPKQAEVTKRESEETAQQQLAAAQQARKYQMEMVEAEKNRFLSQLREKIDANKIYPRRARLREIEGSVAVKFVITKEGKIMITSVEGVSIFKEYAKDAVIKACPLEIPQKVHTLLPLNIELELNYKLI